MIWRARQCPNMNALCTSLFQDLAERADGGARGDYIVQQGDTLSFDHGWPLNHKGMAQVAFTLFSRQTFLAVGVLLS